MTMQRWHAGTSRLRVAAVALGTATALMLGGLGAGAASAAPAGQVDAGVPFSSVVYGTGCTYSLTVPVNSSGRVTFWERKRGFPGRFIGAAQPSGGIATVTWIPRRIGERWLYAIQDGKASRVSLAPVRQGYGSAGLCFAI